MSTSTAPGRILEAPIAGAVLRFGAPLAIGMGLQTTFNLVDAYLISRLDRTVAGAGLGAIGICDQIAALGSIVSYGIATATAALVSQHYGSGDREKARQIAWQSMLMVSIWSVLFAVIGIAGAGFVMRDVVGAKDRSPSSAPCTCGSSWAAASPSSSSCR